MSTISTINNKYVTSEMSDIYFSINSSLLKIYELKYLQVAAAIYILCTVKYLKQLSVDHEVSPDVTM